MSSGPEPSGLTQTIPTTLLQAINQMLKAVGRAEVMSLQPEGMSEDAQSALSMLSDTSVEVQSRGWHFNTETGLPLAPDTADGSISLPVNVASATINPRSFPADVAQRGRRLYDLTNHTFTFTAPVYVDAVLLFQFEELPQPVRWYVMALAGRKYGVGRVPEAATYKFTAAVETDALAAVLQHDQDSRRASLPETSPHFASFRRGQKRII